MKRISVKVPEEDLNRINDLINEKLYTTTSEFVRHAIKQQLHREFKDLFIAKSIF
jgi:Arc/MetJ-type ribon-helix-helix transcriptional regulator